MSTSPEHSRNRLVDQNRQAEEDHLPPCFEIYAPYCELDTVRSDQDLSYQCSLRSALRRYLFVKGDEGRLKDLMVDWNRLFSDKLFFLRDGSHKVARISEVDMSVLRKACDDSRVFFEVPITLPRKGSKIALINTPFEEYGENFEVLDVQEKADGSVVLRLKMDYRSIRFDNLYVTYRNTAVNGNFAAMVSTAQKTLLDIFKRRVNDKETEVSRYEDRIRLKELLSQRSTVFPEKSFVMERHFLALMLICAHLSKDEAVTSLLTAKVTSELAAIAKIRESKAATDTRAYLHVAMYISTGHPKYRDLAKSYIRKYDPSSPYLRQFVSTMSKRSASRHIGPTSRIP